MRKRRKLLVLTLAVMGASALTGCQSVAKNYGGSMTLELELDQKLEEITWKDDSLWYLTRPMTEKDTAETHTFQQSSLFGMFEGTVTIIEKKSR